MSEPVEKSDNIWKEVGDEFLLLPNRLLNALGMFVLFLIHMLPGILILAIILLIAWLVHKGYRKAHPKRQRQVPIPQNEYAQQQPANYPQNPGATRPPVPYPVSTATQPPASPVAPAPSQAPTANGGAAEMTASNDTTSAGDRKTGHDEEPLWRSYAYYDPIIKNMDDDDPLVDLYGPAVIEIEADAKVWEMPLSIPNEDEPDDSYDPAVAENGETDTSDPTQGNGLTDEGRDLKEFLDEMGIEERTSRAKAKQGNRKQSSGATDAIDVFDKSDDTDEEPLADPRTQNMDIWSNVPDATYLSTDENDGDAKAK